MAKWRLPANGVDGKPRASVVVATRVRQLRLVRDWTYEQAAEALGPLGCSWLDAVALSRIERGERKYVTVEELEAFCRLYEVSPNELLGVGNELAAPTKIGENGV